MKNTKAKKEELQKNFDLYSKLSYERKYFELIELLDKENSEITFKSLKSMQKKDIEFETGKKCRLNIYALKESLKRKIFLGLYLASIGFILKTSWTGYLLKGIHNVNIENMYSAEDLTKLSEIKEQYESDIADYAKDINEHNLSDIEIIIKEIADMWENIYGYKIPGDLYDDFSIMQYNLYYYNYGVCREFADDCADRLNKINPEYNAQSVAVMCKDVELNNIERTIFEERKNKEEEKSKIEEFFHKTFITNETGNHKAVLVTIPDKNYTLLIDPTNPSIGLVDNGKIYILGEQEFFTNYYEFSNVSYYNNLDEFLNYCKVLLQSYFNGITPKKALEEYGIIKQNEVLASVQNLDTKYRTFQEDVLTNIIKDDYSGYETYTKNDILIIKPIENVDLDTRKITDFLYHVINLRLKEDGSIKRPYTKVHGVIFK